MGGRRRRAGRVSFLDRIDECNVHDPANFVPFAVAGQRVGLVKHGFAGRLKEFPGAFAVVNTDSVGTVESSTSTIYAPGTNPEKV